MHLKAMRTASQHNRYQMEYYRHAGRRAIRPVDTPYVRRHFDNVRTAARLDGAQKTIEIGCGNGRFTRFLLDLGLHVVANDVSPATLETMESKPEGAQLEILVCELEDLHRHTEGRRFDRAVGFFVLHHLHDLDTAFASLASVLEPGARIAFCEPNGYNPLFYLQILVTPSMTWQGERGLPRMTPRRVLGAMARQGFTDLDVERYGFFPPFLVNRAAGRRLEAFLEKSRMLDPLRAFQVFSGRFGR